MRVPSLHRLKPWFALAWFTGSAAFYGWLALEAVRSGVFEWRGRSTLLADDPVGFYDGVILSFLAALVMGGLAGLMLWGLLDHWGEDARIDRYLAKRRAETDHSRDRNDR